MRFNRALRNVPKRLHVLQRGISPTEAARYLNISQSNLYNLIQRGQIPSRKVNEMRVISRGALMDYCVRKRNVFDDC